jgi:hypothetical protein
MTESEKIIKEQQDAEATVLTMLATDMRCRNDDVWLILQVWQKMQHINILVPFNEIGRMITPETITRVRRQIQNTNGEFLPTDPQVLLRRKVKEAVLKAYYTGRNPAIIREWEELRYKIK